jgi:hypothetical protein
LNYSTHEENSQIDSLAFETDRDCQPYYEKRDVELRAKSSCVVDAYLGVEQADFECTDQSHLLIARKTQMYGREIIRK